MAGILRMSHFNSITNIFFIKTYNKLKVVLQVLIKNEFYNLSFVCLVGSALAANVLATSSNDNELQQHNAEPVNLTA